MVPWWALKKPISEEQEEILCLHKRVAELEEQVRRLQGLIVELRHPEKNRYDNHEGGLLVSRRPSALAFIFNDDREDWEKKLPSQFTNMLAAMTNELGESSSKSVGPVDDIKITEDTASETVALHQDSPNGDVTPEAQDQDPPSAPHAPIKSPLSPINAPSPSKQRRVENTAHKRSKHGLGTGF
jgi:hypothetical protein